MYYKTNPEDGETQRPVIVKLPLFRLSLKVTDLIFKLFDSRKKMLEVNSQKASVTKANFTIRKTN